MYEKELIAVGVGDVPAWLADEGLELAVEYFEDNSLSPQTCFEAKNDQSDSELAMHWDKAEKLTNNVLLGDSRYDNSMISLDFDVY
ncbi:MAG: hypothetical protein OEY06_08770 [Gammaproteobacteria bacterium]|nr:hypothetical protein [Gammaproteobacteria bacterium]